MHSSVYLFIRRSTMHDIAGKYDRVSCAHLQVTRAYVETSIIFQRYQYAEGFYAQVCDGGGVVIAMQRLCTTAGFAVKDVELAQNATSKQPHLDKTFFNIVVDIIVWRNSLLNPFIVGVEDTTVILRYVSVQICRCCVRQSRIQKTRVYGNALSHLHRFVFCEIKLMTSGQPPTEQQVFVREVHDKAVGTADAPR